LGFDLAAQHQQQHQLHHIVQRFYLLRAASHVQGYENGQFLNCPTFQVPAKTTAME